MEEPRKLKVAVIGAGPAGLVSLRHLGDQLDKFEPVAFEQAPHVGGNWWYTEDVGVDSTTGRTLHTTTYRDLRTYIPKEVMAFPDFAFRDDLPSYVGLEDVRDYLIDYAQHFNLLPFIKLNHVVEYVRPLKDNDEKKNLRWHIDVRDLKTNNVTSHEFDAVMICNGNHFEPHNPDIQSLDEFKGLTMHSRDYRVPEPFKDRSVLVFGAGVSGTDIVVEIAPFVKKVYLCHDLTPFPASSLPENVQQKVGIERMTSDAAILKNGERVEADTLIMCTGYRFHFPFLSDECHPLLLHDGQVISGLYLHLIHAAFPTMSFVGILKQTCPFPLCDRQVRFLLATLDGRVSLPSTEEMLEDVRKQMATSTAAGKSPHRFHVMPTEQWAYNDKLAELAGCERLPPVIANLFQSLFSDRVANLKSYRSCSFKILDQQTFTEIS